MANVFPYHGRIDYFVKFYQSSRDNMYHRGLFAFLRTYATGSGTCKVNFFCYTLEGDKSGEISPYDSERLQTNQTA